MVYVRYHSVPGITCLLDTLPLQRNSTGRQLHARYDVLCSAPPSAYGRTLLFSRLLLRPNTIYVSPPFLLTPFLIIIHYKTCRAWSRCCGFEFEFAFEFLSLLSTFRHFLSSSSHGPGRIQTRYLPTWGFTNHIASFWYLDP